MVINVSIWLCRRSFPAAASPRLFFFFFEDWRLHGKFMFVLNWFSHLALYTCLGGGNPPTDLLFAPVLPGCDFHFTSKVKISFPRQKDWRVLMQRGGAIGGNQSKLPANLGAVNFPTTTTVGFPPVWNSNYFGTEFCHSWRWNDIRRMFSFLTNLDKSGSSRQLCNYVFTLSAPPPQRRPSMSGVFAWKHTLLHQWVEREREPIEWHVEPLE